MVVFQQYQKRARRHALPRALSVCCALARQIAITSPSASGDNNIGSKRHRSNENIASASMAGDMGGWRRKKN